MTKFRVHFPLLACACATALALSTAATAAEGHMHWNNLAQKQWGNTSPSNDLPPAPPPPSPGTMSINGDYSLGRNSTGPTPPARPQAKLGHPAAKLKLLKTK